MEFKYCTKCGKTKRISEFHREIGARDGFQRWCKLCKQSYNTERDIGREEEIKNHNTEYKRTHRKETRGYNLQYKHGITLEEYDEMLEAQGNMCAICGVTPEKNGKRLYVDHNHNTGIIRGLLCDKCNKALGFFQDNSEICKLAALYLQEEFE